MEVAAKVASILIGPGASRLLELEKQTRRRFYLQPKQDTHLDHFLVLAEGKREELAPAAPVAEGAKIELKLVEVGLHDANAGVGKLDGLDICVANAAKQVGKKVEVQIERVLDGAVYATLVSQAVAADEPITAESEAEKPTRRSASATAATTAKTAELDDPELEDEDEEDEPEADDLEADEPEADEPEAEAVSTADGTSSGRPEEEDATRLARRTKAARRRPRRHQRRPETARANRRTWRPRAQARIHVPDPDLGEPESRRRAGRGRHGATQAEEEDAQRDPGGRGRRRRRRPRGAAGTDGSRGRRRPDRGGEACGLRRGAGPRTPRTGRSLRTGNTCPCPSGTIFPGT